MKKFILIIVFVDLTILLFTYLKIKPIYGDYKDNLDNRMARVYYAVQDLEQGDIIYANLITTKEIYAKDLESDYVRDPKLVIGKCVKENIKAQDIIKSSLVENCR